MLILIRLCDGSQQRPEIHRQQVWQHHAIFFTAEKWLTNQVETGGFNSDTICLNTL
jgi:hypothetical protein